MTNIMLMTKTPPLKISPPFPFAPQHYLAPVMILVIALSAFFFELQLRPIFIYERELVAQGELWRLFSATFLHTNASHFVMNGLALTLLWALQGHTYTIKRYLIIFFGSAVFASIGIYLGSPELNQYVGLSGALHGIFIWSTLHEILAKDKTAYFLLIGGLTKIAYEQFIGAAPALSEVIQAKVAIDAHLWGAIGGSVLFFAMLCFKQVTKRGASSLNDESDTPPKN